MTLNFLKKIFSGRPDLEVGVALYRAIANQSREPIFYLEGGVADTVDGRFDLLALNSILVLRRLKGRGEHASRISQALFDVMFQNIDEGLREDGVGDLSVGGKIKGMAEAYYGRVAAYEDAIQGKEGADMKDALSRNLYRDVEVNPDILEVLADYVERQVKSLDEQSLDDLLAGKVKFEALKAPENA